MHTVNYNEVLTMSVKKRKGRMVAGVAGAVIAVLAISVLLPVVSTMLGSADDVEQDLAINSTLSGHLSGAGKKDYYKIVVDSGTKLTVKTDGPNSGSVDFDLYIKKDAKPTTTSYLARGYTSSADETVSVSNPAGTYYVMVYDYKGSGDYTISAILETGSNGGNDGSGNNSGGNNDNVVELTSGVAKTGSLDASNTKAYYKITASSGTALKVVLDGPNGADFDLYVKKGAMPTTSSYDVRGYTNSADESVSINNPSGTYYIMVNRYSGSGQFTITATVESGNNGGNGGNNSDNVVELTSGVAKTGSLDASNTKAYYKITASSGTALKVVLDGPNGADFDLYVKKGAMPTTSSYDARGYTNSADESVSISNPSGTYYIMVNRYSGSGQFTITATVESGNNGGGNGGNTTAKWTYVGIAGYDADDITTMVNSTVSWFKNIGSDANVNILLLTDEYGHGNTHAYYITPQQTAMEIPLNEINSAWTNEVNTGDKSVLVSFFRYAVTHYPAEHYYLHTDSHSRCGLSILYDETNYDRMDFTEIKSALAEIYNIIHKKIDIFWYGGCWQMNLASAYQIYNYVEFMGGSEHTDAHPMRAPLSKIKSNPNMSTRDVLVEAVNLVASSGSPPYAYGGVDLSKIPALVSKVDALSQALIAKMSTYRSAIIEARNATQEYEQHYGAPYADLYHLAQNLKAKINDTTIQSMCTDVMNAVSNAVVNKKYASGWGENLLNSNGIGIMFPKDWYTFEANQTYFTISDFARNTQWDEFYAKLNGFAGLVEFSAGAAVAGEH